MIATTDPIITTPGGIGSVSNAARGGMIHMFDAATGGFVATAGTGRITGFDGPERRQIAQANMARDNHLIRV